MLKLKINAWNIVRNVSFIELFKLMKCEGHLFVWYTIIMPFYAVENYYNYNSHFLNFYLGNLIIYFKLIFALLYSFLLIFSGLFFSKNIKPLFFLFLTQLLLVIIFSKIYAGEYWHFCFLFIYLFILLYLYGFIVQNFRFLLCFKKYI